MLAPEPYVIGLQKTISRIAIRKQGSYKVIKWWRAYLDVLVVSQARGNAGESIVVEVQLPQVGNISHCAIFHRADVIVAQAKPTKEKPEMWVYARMRKSNLGAYINY